MTKRRTDLSNLPDERDIQRYEMLVPVLTKMQGELKELSKKKQDEALNELKVKMVNRVLTQIKDLMKEQPTSQFLDLLDSDTLPSNSDAVLILSQYEAALEAFRERYYKWDGTDHRWLTKENP